MILATSAFVFLMQCFSFWWVICFWDGTYPGPNCPGPNLPRTLKSILAMLGFWKWLYCRLFCFVLGSKTTISSDSELRKILIFVSQILPSKFHSRRIFPFSSNYATILANLNGVRPCSRVSWPVVLADVMASVQYWDMVRSQPQGR